MTSNTTSQQQLVSEYGLECERHVYRTLFSTLLSTPTSDLNKLNLLYQFFTEFGPPLFTRSNFSSLIHFALSYDPSSGGPNTSWIRGAHPEIQSSSPETSTSSLGSVNQTIVNRVNEISKHLKLSETEKLVILVSLNELNACESEIDLQKCQFSTSSELTHHLLTQLSNSRDPKAQQLVQKIQEGTSCYPVIDCRVY